MCAGRSWVDELGAGLKPGLRVSLGARGVAMMDLRIWKEKKMRAFSAALGLILAFGAPVSAQSADTLPACRSDSWSVGLASLTGTGQAVLRMDGVDVDLVARIQQAFGDHALVAVSPDAGLVLNVVLRASGDDLIRVQPFGQESAEEVATCDDAFIEAVTGGASQ